MVHLSGRSYLSYPAFLQDDMRSIDQSANAFDKSRLLYTNISTWAVWVPNPPRITFLKLVTSLHHTK